MIFLLGCGAPPAVDTSIRLPAADPTQVRFVALGDTGKGNAGQRQVAAGVQNVCRQRGCDFGLLLGDNLYPAGMTSPMDPRMDEVLTDVYGDLGLQFALVLGNHDWGQKHIEEAAAHQLAWAEQRRLVHLPATHYRARAGEVELWAVDTDIAFWEGAGPQGAWLDRTLAASDARWKIVFGHHPYRSDGRHGNAGSYEGWSHIPYVSGSSLLTFFEDHVVGAADLYLAGHDHNLQSFSHNGLELVVSGAGASTRGLTDRGNQPDLAFGQIGFAWVSVGQRTEVALYDADGQLLGARCGNLKGSEGLGPCGSP